MATNPPIPAGFKLLAQSSVSAAMTAWAVRILRDPVQFPMFATDSQHFESRSLLARVEWHPPNFHNSVTHRGVTLYETIASAAQSLPSEMAGRARGIDVSGYQPVIDWQAVAGSGVSFAFIKASEATAFRDRSFAQHWPDAKRAQLLRGAYHFFRPKLDPVLQAQHFLRQLVSDPGELPPVLDVEVTDGVPSTKLVAGVRAWVSFVSARLGRPLIYTSPSFWGSLAGAEHVSTLTELWIGAWTTAAPGALGGWSKWTFWQHTSKAVVAGVNAPSGIDADYFNGSLAELRAYSAAFVRARPGQSKATANAIT